MSPFRFGATLIAGVPTFVFRSHFRVHGDSMRPALLSGDLLHVLPRSWTPGGFRRGAVVVAMSPVETGSFWVKRVIGLPGELVAMSDDGRILIDAVPLDEAPKPRRTKPPRRSPGGRSPGGRPPVAGNVTNGIAGRGTEYAAVVVRP